MRILDSQRYWAFVKAYVVTFITLVGLYVVIDAFTNFDEFTEVADGTLDLFRRMGWYYLIRLSLFYDRLCGVMTMMAAIFTVTWMQRNNELLAMLAAGISTYRVIRPVIIAAILVSGLAIVNQEWIIPAIGADELMKPPDDDGQRAVLVTPRDDVNNVLIHGKDGDRASKSVMPLNATIPSDFLGTRVEVEAQRGTYIAPEDRSCPLRGGWYLSGVKLTPPDVKIPDDFGLLVPLDDEALNAFPAALRRDEDLSPRVYFLKGHKELLASDEPTAIFLAPFATTLTEPATAARVELRARQARYVDDQEESPIRGGWLLKGVTTLPSERPEDPLAKLLIPLPDKVLRTLPEPLRAWSELAPRAYFLRTHLSFAAITRNEQWYQFAPTLDLIRGLRDPANSIERTEMAVYLHSRLLRPLLSLTLLLVTLPQVLGGEGRNMFINLGLSLGTSALFYGMLFICQYLGNNAIIAPELATWIPLFLSGTLAVARWDQIRT